MSCHGSGRAVQNRASRGRFAGAGPFRFTHSRAPPVLSSRAEGEGPQPGGIFDSVFKTLLNKAPQLLVPFINEVFGRDYPPDAEIVQFSTEHESLQGTTIADSVFR